MFLIGQSTELRVNPCRAEADYQFEIRALVGDDSLDRNFFISPVAQLLLMNF